MSNLLDRSKVRWCHRSGWQLFVLAVFLVGMVTVLKPMGASEPPHVVLIGGDGEYSSRETCAVVEEKLRNHFKFRTTLIESHVGSIENEDNPDRRIPGIEAVKDADLLIIYIRMRFPPAEELDLLDEYFKSGKPAIGIRTTSHGFTNDRGWCPRYFGGHYWSHFGGTTRTYVIPEMANHPVLRGVAPFRVQRHNTLYLTNPLSDTAMPLVLGRRDDTTPAQSYAWINEYVPGSRQFFYTASHPEDIAEPDNQALLYNAIFWCLEYEVPKGGVLSGFENTFRAERTAFAGPIQDRFPRPPSPQASSAATSLFSGSDLQEWDYWFGGKEPRVYDLDGRAHSGEGLPDFDGARWKIEDGAAVATLGYGDIVTREQFADYKLHLDFLIPELGYDESGIWRGNSGVYLNGRYEIQIHDSAGEETTALTRCGAINGVKEPDRSAWKAAGEWQHLEAWFRAPRFQNGRKVSDARASVFLNGIQIHDNIVISESTDWGFPEEGSNGPLTGPIRLQADSAPVRFANITVESLSQSDAAEILPYQRPLTGRPFIDMNYGPFKTHSLEVAPGNFANKAIAVRLDPGPGGVTSGNDFVVFETDTLRMAAGWSGPDFTTWQSIMHDGSHGTHMKTVGHTVFVNPDAPGWANQSGEFLETRFLGRDNRYYGPMDRSLGKWKGLYVHEGQVVFSYRVGGSDVLEQASTEGDDSTRAFARTLNIGPRSKDLVVQVAFQDGVKPMLHDSGQAGGAGAQLAVFPQAQQQTTPNDDAGRPWINLDGATKLVIENSDTLDLVQSDFTIFARVKTEEDGSILSRTRLDTEWVPGGQTLFVRDGRLAFDVGWVGAVESEKEIADGEWHRVAVTYAASDGLVQLYVDGQLDGQAELGITAQVDNEEEAEELLERVKDYQIQLGYTAHDFPNEDGNNYLQGSLGDVRVYKERLSRRDIAGLGRRRSEYNDNRLVARWDFREVSDQSVEDRSGNDHRARIVVGDANTDDGAPNITVAAVVGDTGGTEWIRTDDGHLRLRIPAGDDAVRLKLLLSQVADANDTAEFQTLLNREHRLKDLKSLTRGGKPQWTETVTTQAEVLGNADGPFVVENITLPVGNPYRSWMRIGGFDFFSDPSRAALCTAMGDVWTVVGLGGDLGELKWQRIATGMYEPLGLKIVDDVIYVTCRDQITRLHDLNDDGEIDFYEAFNHDNQASEHYHEFAMCLETDDAGNFYYVKASGHAINARFEQHGTLIKVSPDGIKSEIIARGFRAPNGLWVSGDGKTFLTTDQEGHWTPKNRVNWVEPGGFYGYMMGWHDVEDENDFTPPITWIHNNYDRSPSEALMVTSERWGPFNGKMVHISYGTGKIYNVMHEQTAGGLRQGGISELDIAEMPSGISRTRFHPVDGQLYAAGLFVWCGEKTLPGGFYRIRYTGKKTYQPIGLEVANDGVVLSFTNELNREAAGDSGNYSVEMWNYLRRQQYGSADYKVLSQGEGRDALKVTSATVSADGKSVFLEMPKIQPVMQMHIEMNLRAADGQRMRTYVHNTIHALGDRPGRDLLSAKVAAR